MTRRGLTVLTLSTALLAPACMMDISSDFGITPGGSQDIRLARDIIEDGGVPDASQFTAEGLFSEHDIPAPDTDACDQLLCPRAALAQVSTVDGSGPRVLVQLGFDTNITEFHRSELNLALVVDISSSMTGPKLDATKQALHTLVDQLAAGDRASLVSFDDVAEIELASTAMDAQGREQLHAAIDKLETDGSTNIEAGIAKGYLSMHAHADGSGGREDRMMLFTDAEPNVGATDSASFVGQVQAQAEEGIGISVFGVGIDLGAELASAISQVRGGNSFYLAVDAIATVFDEEFDTIVTPVAYNLHFDVRPAEPFSFAAAYGVPDAAPSGDVEVSLATAFLSKRNGAMAVLLDGPLDLLESGEPVVSFSLEHETLDGELVSQSFEARWLGGDLPIAEPGRADGPGVAKLAVLLDEYLALQAAAETCSNSGLSQADALARIDAAAERLDAVGDMLDDQPLRDEADLMRKLADNVPGC